MCATRSLLAREAVRGVQLFMVARALPLETGVDAGAAPQWNGASPKQDPMKSLRAPDPVPPPAAGATPTTRNRGAPPEDRDWHASSRELAQGLMVVEVIDTLPAEFRDLA